MQSLDELPLRGSSAPLVVSSLVEPPVQGVTVDLEDEDAVEQVDDVREVPRASAEVRHLGTLVGNEGSYPVQAPHMMLVRAAGHRFTRSRVTLIGQFRIAVDRVVAASLQLPADRRLPRAGHAFNEVVPDAHGRMITTPAGGTLTQ